MSNFLIYLFQVRVEVETCENLRPMANNSNAKGMAASYASGGQYGFSDKVVDGITLTVNSVILTLKSHAFIASFQVLCHNNNTHKVSDIYGLGSTSVPEIILKRPK